MEPLPLIPQINSKACPDTSSIIREEFQDILGTASFNLKTALNLKKYNIDSSELKYCGTDINQVYEQMKQKLEDIEDVELSLMKSQGKYLVQRDEEGEMPQVKLLSMPRMYPDIDKRMINKYSLLHMDDLLPHISERLLDIRYNFDDVRCKNLCPVTEKKYEELEEFPFMKTHLPPDYEKRFVTPQKLEKPKQIKKIKKSVSRKSKGIIKHFRNISVDELSVKNKTDEEKIRTKCGTVKKTCKHTKLEVGELVFVAEPTQILFYDYKVNKVYERNLYIRNITTKARNIDPPFLPRDSKFKVEILNQYSRVAPGMFCHLKISFVTDTLTDVMESLEINIPGGRTIDVDLLSFRQTPVLKGMLYSIDDKVSQLFTPDLHNKALNYTIDCGSTLLGYCSEIGIKLKACGGDGKYFMISEDDWEFCDLNDVTEDLHLHLGEFHIYPAFFEMKHGEELDLEVIFHPDSENFHQEKLFLVCNNNTMMEIDVIGDCHLFEIRFFSFIFTDQPPHIGKTEDCPEYSLHMGATYYNKISISHFWINNISPLKISYAWKKRPKDFCKPNMDILSLKDDWVQITPDKGVFQPDCTEEFEIKVVMKSPICGIYNYVLCIYAIDIPENSLSEGYIYDFDEEYYADSDKEEPKLLSILIGDIELQIRNLEMPVFLAPQEINLCSLFYKQETTAEYIKIFNNGFCDIQCEWQYCDCDDDLEGNSLIKLKPNTFEIKAGFFVECSLTVKPLSYDDIDQTLILSIDKDFTQRQLRIQGTVQKPCAVVTSMVQNFGVVRTLTNITHVIPVYNVQDVGIRWCLVEYMFDIATGKIVECSDSHTNWNAGELCHLGSYRDIIYTLDTRLPRQWLSILVFHTYYENTHVEETKHIMILADIIKPKISITGDSIDSDTLQINDQIFLGISKDFKIFLNNDSMVESSYKWGEPYGDDIDKIKIFFEHEAGKIYPNSRKDDFFTLVGKESGIVEEFFMPLIVNGVEEPLVFKIKCTIEYLMVVFSLPFEDRYININWPSKVSSEICSEFYLPSELKLVPEEEASLLKSKETRMSRDELCQFEDISTTVALSDLQTSMFEESTEVNYSDLDFSMTDTTSNIKNVSRNTSSTTFKFGTEDSFHDHIINICDLPCRKAMKKFIFIENITDIASNFEITVTRFHGKDSIPPEGVEKVLLDMKWEFRDEFVEKMTEYGMVIVSKPSSGEILPRESVTIEIWVYAETWGNYIEEIGISVGDMPVFYFNILIQVVGMPIEYPVIKNTNFVEPIIRFGSFSFRSPPVNRNLYFCNNSTIPYKIVWHILNQNDSANSFGEVLPFNMLCDIFGVKNDEEIEETNCKVRIIDYIGEENEKYKKTLFKIHPKEIYLNPKEKGKLQITINPSYYRNYSMPVDVCSYAVGHIYIEEKHRYQPNTFCRPPDLKLGPTTVKILSSFEQPHFDFKHVHGDTCVFMSISDAIKLGVRSVCLRIVLRNNCKASLPASFTVTEPFEIVKVRIIRTNEKEHKEYMVHANECVEIYIKCHLSQYLIMNLADVVYNITNHYLKETKVLRNNQMYINRYLRIYEDVRLIQELPLGAVLSFPNIVVSPSILDFGEVYIGSRKKLCLKLTNKTSSNCWYRIRCSGQYMIKPTEFQVIPTEGTLPPALPTEQSLYLTVSYTPQDILLKEEYLTIETCLEQYSISINLYGQGTYDAKYFIPPLRQEINGKCFKFY